MKICIIGIPIISVRMHFIYVQTILITLRKGILEQMLSSFIVRIIRREKKKKNKNEWKKK